MIKFQLAVSLFVLFSAAVNAEVLCKAEEKSHDLVIGEAEYNLEEASDSLEFLQSKIPEIIKIEHQDFIEKILNGEPLSELEKLYSPVLTQEAFYIGYPNSLAIVHGTLLKQNVLILKYKYALSNKAPDKQAFESALKEFCEFESSVSYVD